MINKVKDCIKKAIELELKKTDASNSSSNKRNNDDNNNIDSLSTSCCDMIVPKFTALVKTALPFVGRIAFNISSLWDFTLTLWNNCYKITLDEVVHNIIISYKDNVDNQFQLASKQMKDVTSEIQRLMSVAYWDATIDNNNVKFNENWGMLVLLCALCLIVPILQGNQIIGIILYQNVKFV